MAFNMFQRKLKFLYKDIPCSSKLKNLIDIPRSAHIFVFVHSRRIPGDALGHGS